MASDDIRTREQTTRKRKVVIPEQLIVKRFNKLDAALQAAPTKVLKKLYRRFEDTADKALRACIKAELDDREAN